VYPEITPILRSTEAKQGTNGFERLRIVMVTAQYVPQLGPIQIHTYEVARSLAAAGHEITILTTDASGTLAPAEYIDGVQILRVPVWQGKLTQHFAPNIYRIIRRGSWHLVHCQGYQTWVAPMTMLAALRARIPYVLSFHSSEWSQEGRNGRAMLAAATLRPLLARAEKLIGHSDSEREFYRRRLRLAPKQFVTIDNGAYLPRKEEDFAANASILVVALGSSDTAVGPRSIIRALPELAQQYPNVQLRIIGAGTQESELRQVAVRCGVATRVVMEPGEINDRSTIASAIAKAHLLIPCGDDETAVTALLAGLSRGIPALVAGGTGLANMADGGMVRVVAPETAPGRLAPVMAEQLQRPAKMSRQHLSSWDRCATMLLDVYCEARKKIPQEANAADGWSALAPDASLLGP
jgi:glycosyltransferase involved in cell wall biosynthesis